MTREKILKYLKAEKTWVSIANNFEDNTMTEEEIEIKIDYLEELITLIEEYDTDKELKLKVDSMIEISELLHQKAEKND